MSDYRYNIVKSVEESLIGIVDTEQLHIISNVVTRVLNDYEVTERCTDLVIRDTNNERLIKRYCACLVIDGKSEKTIYQYRNALQAFDAMMGIDFAKVGAYDIRYYLACKTSVVSNRTLENTRSYLSSFFRWMVEEDIITKNPADKIKPVKYTEEVRLPFSDVELDSMRMACSGERDRAMLEMLVSTGVRLNELASMDIQDINFPALTVHVRHGKGGKERIVYMTSVAAKHLETYLKTRTDTDPALFLSRQHDRISRSGIWRAVKAIGKRAGVEDVHPHRFRRTLATGLAKKGMDIQDIQKILGHSNINTTMVYVASDNDKIHASYNKFIAQNAMLIFTIF